MSGPTPPSSSTTSWLFSSIDSDSDHSAYFLASSEPALSRWTRSEALPAAAIEFWLSWFSDTSRHSDAAAVDSAAPRRPRRRRWRRLLLGPIFESRGLLFLKSSEACVKSRPYADYGTREHQDRKVANIDYDADRVALNLNIFIDEF